MKINNILRLFEFVIFRLRSIFMQTQTLSITESKHLCIVSTSLNNHRKSAKIQYKNRLFLFLFLLLNASLLAQVDTVQKNNNYAKNTVFFEFLGNGGFYSLNYDRILKEVKNHKISIRGGISFSILTNLIYPDIKTTDPIPFPWGLPDGYYGDGLYNKSLILPTEINYLIGKKYFFEIGGGLTGDIHLIKNMYGSSLYLFTRIAGFRFQKENGGFFFRAGLVPSFKIFLYKNEFLFDPLRYYFSYISVDFGYTLKNKHKHEK